MMLLKQQNWEQWLGAGISSGNWGVCQEACSPAGGPSAPTPHLSSKHTQLAPPLCNVLQPDPAAESLAIPGLFKPSSILPTPPPQPHSRIGWQVLLAEASEQRMLRPETVTRPPFWRPYSRALVPRGNQGSGEHPALPLPEPKCSFCPLAAVWTDWNHFCLCAPSNLQRPEFGQVREVSSHFYLRRLSKEQS